MNYFKSTIISNQKISPEHCMLSFTIAPGTAKKTKPGQFFNIRVSDACEPFLRRPFGAHEIGKDRITIFYKVVGKATKLLSAKKKDESLDILGPLGNGFTIVNPFHPRSGKDSTPGVGRVFCVAGGHGVAPLYALAKRIGSYKSRVAVFVGGGTKKDIVCDAKFRKLGVKVLISTDDGSKGYKGLVTDLLNKKIPSTIDHRPSTIYACGPKPMLKAVSEIAISKNIPCEISADEYMGCGTGICMGCAIKTKSGTKLVCKDGPVFKAEDIVW